MNLAPVTLAIHTLGHDARQEFIDEVRAGLTATPKRLSPRWFYDDRGCELFDLITGLPEYYQTRTERSILEQHAPALMRRVHPPAIGVLGAGSGNKPNVLVRRPKGMGSLWTFG